MPWNFEIIQMFCIKPRHSGKHGSVPSENLPGREHICFYGNFDVEQIKRLMMLLGVFEQLNA